MDVRLPDAVSRQWRGAYMSIAVGALSLLSASASIVAAGRISWTLTGSGALIALSGMQTHTALQLTRRLDPDRVRTWMLPLLGLLYVLGAAVMAFGLTALMRRGTFVR